jgi:RNA polymerase sigma factor (sigma-70 family)
MTFNTTKQVAPELRELWGEIQRVRYPTPRLLDPFFAQLVTYIVAVVARKGTKVSSDSDLVQAVLLKFIEKLGSIIKGYRTWNEVSGLLNRMVCGLTVDQCRKDDTQARLRQKKLQLDGAEPELRDDQFQFSEEDFHRLEEAIKGLDKEHMDAIRLFGSRNEDAAAQLNISVPTFRKRKKEAIESLKRVLLCDPSEGTSETPFTDRRD